jgi:opacity protein-like surface antigen
MKFLFIFCFLLMLEKEVLAQNHFTATVGQSFSTIKFKNSRGEANDKYQFVSGNRLQIGYGLNLGSDGFLQIEPGYRFGGAKLMIQPDLIELRLHYADLGLAYDHVFDLTDYITIRPGIGLYGAYLISGQQQIANSYFNLKETKDLSRADFGLQLRGGIHYNISPDLHLGLQYAFLLGFLNLESGESNKKQGSWLRSNILGISLISEISL